jgi:hypothetical protein
LTRSSRRNTFPKWIQGLDKGCGNTFAKITSIKKKKTPNTVFINHFYSLVAEGGKII